MRPRFFKNSWLALGLVLGIILVALEAPLWIQVFCAVTLLARLLMDFNYLPGIPRWLANVAAALVLAEVIFQYKTILNQEASAVLLLGITAIKILDYVTENDLKFLFLLGLLLLTLKPLFSFEIYWVIPGLVALLGMWMGLASLFKVSRAQYLLKIFAYSTPLTLILFVVFPRVVLPWAKMQAQHHSTVGFQESMNPGDVESMVESPKLAFRVTFQGAQIQTRNLYWRGAIFLKSNGLSWAPGSDENTDEADPTLTVDMIYHVLLEPDEQSYLFSLEQPILLMSQDEPLTQMGNHVYRSQLPHSHVVSYEGRSHLRFDDTLEAGKESAQLLQVPKLDKQTQELVRKMKAPSQLSDRLKNLDKFFSEKTFRYTLHPGIYQDNQLSDFLFQRRRGFCEHFAGAYATLARALGIPARVVLGYQGASYNSFGDFWEVSSRDAHAWVEVLLDERWQRKDPTRFVAPLRIELGAQTFFELPENERNLSNAALLQSLGLKPGNLLLSYVTYFVNNLNYQWSNFVLNFSNQQAKAWLWENLGSITVFLLLLFVLVLFIPLLKTRLIWPVRKRALSREILYSIMKFLGDKRRPSDTPLFVLQQIAEHSQDCRAYMQILAHAYEAESYQGKSIDSSLRDELRRGWRKLRSQIREVCQQLPKGV